MMDAASQHEADRGRDQDRTGRRDANEMLGGGRGWRVAGQVTPGHQQSQDARHSPLGDPRKH